MYIFLADTGIRMYDLLNYLSFVVLIIYNFTLIKTKKANLSNLSTFLNERFFKSKSSVSVWVFAVAELFIISILQGAFIGVINEAFADVLDTGTNYFGTMFFGPVILFVWFYLIGVNPLKEMDLITPAYSLRLIVAKLACFCAGCCEGFECSWGLYFPENDAVQFPSQLLEAFVALIIFVLLTVYRKKAKEGTLFPVYLILYSVTRFFTEFTRTEEEVFWILKLYHILCLVGVVVGILWLLIVKKYSYKIVALYEKAPLPFVSRNKSE